MGIMDTDKTLPANRLIFEVRRDRALLARFQSDLDGLMSDYGLSDAEKKALGDIIRSWLEKKRVLINNPARNPGHFLGGVWNGHKEHLYAVRDLITRSPFAHWPADAGCPAD